MTENELISIILTSKDRDEIKEAIDSLSEEQAKTLLLSVVTTWQR